jgi:tocopherol O-methyltransferase
MSTAPFHKQPVNPPRHNDKRKIVEHYDFVSPYSRSLWGEHLHHGYWIRGDESKEEAQLQLAEHLAELANVQTGSTVLDIGCGLGGSSIYLAQKYKAPAIRITISPVQVEMARKAAAAAQLDARFLLMDAEALDFQQSFDLLWSVESISHYHDHRSFFANAVRFLKPGGVFALTDWFKRAGLSAAQEQNGKRFCDLSEIIPRHARGLRLRQFYMWAIHCLEAFRRCKLAPIPSKCRSPSCG